MWKGRACELRIWADRVDLYLSTEDEPSWTVYDPIKYSPTDSDGIGVHTDPRYGCRMERRYMREGVMAGLETRRDHLPGRFLICKAIGLAVHLGASTITLFGTEHVDARAARNLATMVRPLKGRRVMVLDPIGYLGLFPTGDEEAADAHCD